ncbi:MAG: SHOCT domain-containing protein [Chloroflexi bacterium]|nr:SHOCT domain-containing protein [Chloroflexota bacterium]
MMRRRTVVRRGRPGLLGTAARTAVIAGTATATAGVVHHAMNKGKEEEPPQEQLYSVEAEQQAEIQQLQSQMAAMQTQATASPAQTQASPASGPDRISQLKELAQLKESGVLTDEEFQQEKARILSS